MSSLPYHIYQESIPSEKQQQILVGLLIDRIKTLDVLTELSVIGYLHSGEIIAREVATALRRKCYLLPVLPFVADYNGIPTICGSLSGINDANKYNSSILEQLQKDKCVLEAIQKLKRQAITSALSTEACVSLIQDREKLSKSTALLIDSAFISKTKFEVGIESLVSLNFSRVVPVAPFVNKETLIGASNPLKSGYYLKEFDNSHDLHQFIQRINGVDDKTLKAMLQVHI